jgi:sensor c-di-GMP phosphodiesterase-like protein
MAYKEKVIDLEEYRSRKELKETIERLDQLGYRIYNNPMDPDGIGYKNFLKFLKKLDKKYDKDS